MRGLGAHKPGGRSHVAGAARLAAAAASAAGPSALLGEGRSPIATQVPVSTPQQHTGATLLSGDTALLRFKKVWQAQGNENLGVVANAAEANTAAAAEGRSSSDFAAMLQPQQLSCVGASSYSSAFSRLTASLSKAAAPAAAAAAATHPGKDQSVTPSAGAEESKLRATAAAGSGGISQGLRAASSALAAFHYKGSPSSGRLLPLGRLHAHDPTLEGRIEAFIAECCDAAGCSSGNSDNGEGLPFPGAAAVANAVNGADGDTGAGRSEEREQQRTQQRPQQRQQLRVTATVGALTGKYTGWKICLPVALPAMLEEQAEANVTFEETLGEGYAVVAGMQGTNSAVVDGPATRKDGEKDGQQQSPLLQELLQRLLEARRQAYELLPAKRVYEVVERRGSRATAAGQKIVQTVEEQDEEEAGFGGARVLRYRLLDTPIAISPQRRGGGAPAAFARPCPDGEAQVECNGAERLDSSTKQASDQEIVVAGAAARHGDKNPATASARKNQKQRAHAEQGKRKTDMLKMERQRGYSTDPLEHGTTQVQQRHFVEVIERVPLGCRFIYRPKSDCHIRVAAESEIVSSVTLPLQHLNQQKRSQQREQQGVVGSLEEEGGQRVEFAQQLHLEEGDVKQRWWAVHDVWELRPRRSEHGSETSHHQGLQQQVLQQKESEQEDVVDGPRWSVVISEEGEIEDCSTDAVTLLLRRLASGNNKAAADLLKRNASRSSAANRTAADTATAAATTEELFGTAEDVDRYEETKRTSVQLVGCGVEMQQQRGRQQQLQKNLFGALALLLVENAQVLARWFDESFERAGARPAHGAGTGVMYYPNHMGDAVQAVQRHYNQRKLISAGRSRVTGLRLHNNQVKRMMVYKYVERGQSVLELACGHGQDLWKYAERCISKFVGVDLSLSEIREARRRMREGDRGAQHMLQQMLHPPVFHVGNLVDRRALNFLKAEQFDIVSIQLSIHYMVETEKQARGVLARAAAHLKEGGLLLGSTVCCDAIACRLLQLRPVSPAALLPGERSAGALASPYQQHLDSGSGATLERDGAAGQKADDGYEFGNDLYSVTFSRSTLRKLLEDYPDPTIAEVAKKLQPKQDTDAAAGLEEGSPSTDDESGALFASVTSPAAQTALVEYLRNRLAREFGLSYHFYLADSIDAKEFVLPWRSLCAVAASVGLKLVSSMTFPEFLAAAATDPRCGRDLTKWLSTLTPSKQLDKPQFEAFSLYKIFVFKRVSRTTGTLAETQRGGISSQGVTSRKISNDSVPILVGASSSQVAASAAAAEGFAAAATECGRLSTLNLNSSGSIFHDSSNSGSSSSTGGSRINLEERAGYAPETAGLVAARVPRKPSEGGILLSAAAAAASAGGGAPGTTDEAAIKSLSSSILEGVPLKRRRREDTQLL